MTKFRTLLSMIFLAACATSSQQTLTDPQIAMVLRVANLGEVREGEVARAKAADASVRDFASMMVTEHAALNNKTESELSRRDVFSEDTTLSRQIDADSGAAAERLRALSGAAFDGAYINRQVEAHQYLLTLIDATLTPHARKKILRDQLADLRKLTDKHLTRAKQIQSALPR